MIHETMKMRLGKFGIGRWILWTTHRTSFYFGQKSLMADFQSQVYYEVSTSLKKSNL